jgi:hypothetical protein
MFYYFIEDYKKIYTGQIGFIKQIGKMKSVDKILLIIFIITGMIFGGLLLMKKSSFLVIGAMCIEFIVIIGWKRREERKLNKIYLENYRKMKIEPLIKLLKSKEYQLANLNGLEWLLSMCNQRLARKSLSLQVGQPIINFYRNVLLPILTFICGSIVAHISVDEIINLGLLLIGSLTMVFGICYAFYPIIIQLIDGDKQMIEMLRDDLSFIKIGY